VRVWKPKRQAPGFDQALPINLTGRAFRTIRKAISDEVHMDKLSGNTRKIVQEVKDRKPIDVLVVRPEPRKMAMHAEMGLQLV
jgi:hypothetical protein